MNSNFLKSFNDCEIQKELIDEDKDEFNMNKENIVIDNTKDLESLKRSSRVSILTCFDPFNRNDIIAAKEVDLYHNNERNANTSINLLSFDSSTNECFVDEVKTPTKFVNYENNFISPTNSPHLSNLSNISQMLDESVDKNKVETDILIGLSPVPQMVDINRFNNLKKYHNEKKQTWLEKENQLEERLVNLKNVYEDKINDLLIENEGNLENMRANHLKVLTSQQLENEEIVKDMEILINEMVAQESDRFRHLLVCDQYSDTLVEVIKENTEYVNKLQLDNQNIESMLKNYFNKFDKCSKVIEILKQNESALLSKIDEDNIKLEKLTLDINENSKLLSTTKQSNCEEMMKMRDIYEKRLRVLEVKTKHLDNIQNNLRMELNLRIKERDQLTENINQLLRDD